MRQGRLEVVNVVVEEMVVQLVCHMVEEVVGYMEQVEEVVAEAEAEAEAVAAVEVEGEVVNVVVEEVDYMEQLVAVESSMDKQT